jgi:hypothetical protein
MISTRIALVTLAAAAGIAGLTGCSSTSGTPTATAATTTTSAAETTYTAPKLTLAQARDKAFLEIIREAGFPGTDTAVVSAGHSVCDAADVGLSFMALVNAVGSPSPNNPAGYTPKQTGQFIGASIAAYCPEHQTLYQN